MQGFKFWTITYGHTMQHKPIFGTATHGGGVVSLGGVYVPNITWEGHRYTSFGGIRSIYIYKPHVKARHNGQILHVMPKMEWNIFVGHVLSLQSHGQVPERKYLFVHC